MLDDDRCLAEAAATTTLQASRFADGYLESRRHDGIFDHKTIQLCYLLISAAANDQYFGVYCFAHHVDQYPPHKVSAFADLAQAILLASELVLSVQDAVRLIGMVTINYYECYEARTLEHIGVGLSREVSLMNHDCEPNCYISFAPRRAGCCSWRGVVQAVKDIRVNEPVTIRYTGFGLGRTERRRQLQEGYFFLCRCKLCEEEAEEHNNVMGDYLDKVRSTFLEGSTPSIAILIRVLKKLLLMPEVPFTDSVMQKLLLTCSEELIGIEEQFAVLFIYITESLPLLEPNTVIRPSLYKHCMELIQLGDVLLSEQQDSCGWFSDALFITCGYLANQVIYSRMGRTVNNNGDHNQLRGKWNNAHSEYKVSSAFKMLFSYFLKIITLEKNIDRREDGLGLYKWLRTAN